MLRTTTTFVGTTLIAGMAYAQGAQPLPQTPVHAATPAQEETAKPATPAAAKAYPAIVPKQLWATNDFRGKPAPKIEVEEWLSDKPDWTGKTLLVDFWATWCPPCRKLIPELEAWQAKYKNDLVVVGITNEPAKTVANFVDLRGGAIRYALARDGQNRTNKQIDVKGIPHVLVISSDGVVRWQGFPLSDEEPLTEVKLKQIIDADRAARAAAPKAGAQPESKIDAKPESKSDAKSAGKDPEPAHPDGK